MRRIARILGFLTLIVLACSTTLGTPATAEAQAGRLASGGMDLHLFRPAVDSKGYLATNGTDVLGHLDFSFGLIVDGGFGLLPFDGFANVQGATEPVRCGGEGGPLLCGRAVDLLFTGTLHVNLGLFNVLVVGVQLPLGVFARGADITIPAEMGSTGYNLGQMTAGGRLSTTGLDYQGVGNLSAHVKARILRAERNGGFGLAAILQVEFPTGSGAEFVGDNTVVLWPILAAEWRPDRLVRFGLNIGTRLMFGDTPTLPVGGRSEPMDPMRSVSPVLVDRGELVHYGPMLTYSVAGGFRLGDSPVELTVDVYGASIYEAFGQGAGHSLEAMLGLKIFVERSSYLVLSGGAGIPTGGMLASDARAMIGFIFEPSIGDRDGDGLRDDIDECPDQPEDFDNFGDEDGCPDPDNDRDGILDVDDECPMVPEDRDGDADEDGCPEGNEGDRDGDGILDADDQCPDDPEDRDGFEDEDGCPDPDNDQDGILDTDDLCPNDPEDRDGFQDQDGCPDPDNDSDRILDGDDACPNDPETYNGTEDEDGCPDRGTVVIEENSIIILEKIYFETDSAEIQSRSYPILDAVAATLIGNPHITLVEIQGHADERSSDDYNIRLTSDRAAAVVEALVQRGVTRDRLRSAGYGERCPVDPRHTAEAWEQNRRVEFKIVSTVDGPTGVEIACPAGRELIPR
ncbi:MAG: OmpA family protein [Myxococcota bacterium]|nr:OmpA family protein [Myxococcota bacterium]